MIVARSTVTIAIAKTNIQNDLRIGLITLQSNLGCYLSHPHNSISKK